MNSNISPSAWETIGRFLFKVGLSVFFASFGSDSFVLGLSGWLAVFGTATAGVALFRRQRFQFGSFTQWDEVLWLTAGSAGLLLAHEVAIR